MARTKQWKNDEMIAALQETKGMVFLAAKRLGCNPETIRARAKTSPDVAAVLRHQRGEVIDSAELKLFEAIQNGQAWAIAFALKTIGRDRGYGDNLVEQIQRFIAEMTARVQELEASNGINTADDRSLIYVNGTPETSGGAQRPDRGDSAGEEGPASETA